MCDYCARVIKRFPDRYSNEIQKNENTTWRRFLFWVGTALVASSVKFAFPIVMCSSKLPIVVAYSVCYFFHGNANDLDNNNDTKHCHGATDTTKRIWTRTGTAMNESLRSRMVLRILK